jgi:hypothetical protein
MSNQRDEVQENVLNRVIQEARSPTLLDEEGSEFPERSLNVYRGSARPANMNNFVNKTFPYKEINRQKERLFNYFIKETLKRKYNESIKTQDNEELREEIIEVILRKHYRDDNQQIKNFVRQKLGEFFNINDHYSTKGRSLLRNVKAHPLKFNMKLKNELSEAAKKKYEKIFALSGQNVSEATRVQQRNPRENRDLKICKKDNHLAHSVYKVFEKKGERIVYALLSDNEKKDLKNETDAVKAEMARTLEHVPYKDLEESFQRRLKKKLLRNPKSYRCHQECKPGFERRYGRCRPVCTAGKEINLFTKRCVYSKSYKERAGTTERPGTGPFDKAKKPKGRTGKRRRSRRDNDDEEENSSEKKKKAASKIQSFLRRRMRSKQLNAQNSPRQSPKSSSNEKKRKAASKIQSFLRRRMRSKQLNFQNSPRQSPRSGGYLGNSPRQSQSSNSEKKRKAATKIQALIRGKRDRLKSKKLKQKPTDSETKKFLQQYLDDDDFSHDELEGDVSDIENVFPSNFSATGYENFYDKNQDLDKTASSSSSRKKKSKKKSSASPSRKTNLRSSRRIAENKRKNTLRSATQRQNSSLQSISKVFNKPNTTKRR